MNDNEMFNQMSEYYDFYRPDYPEEIIHQVVERAGLTPSSHILEIGAGSGKATAQFVNYGFDILCVEPGQDLAERGKRRFAGKKVEYITSTFEACLLPANHFDAVISAQAFHWIRKPDGYRLCSRCLKNNGGLMPFWNIEIIRDTNIDRERYELISKYDAYTAVMREDAYCQRVKNITEDIQSSGLFSHPEVIQIERELCFTAEQYFGYAMTGNIFVKNSEEKKQAFYENLKSLELKYGSIQRSFISELYIAEKLR